MPRGKGLYKGHCARSPKGQEEVQDDFHGNLEIVPFRDATLEWELEGDLTV